MCDFAILNKCCNSNVRLSSSSRCVITQRRDADDLQVKLMHYELFKRKALYKYLLLLLIMRFIEVNVSLTQVCYSGLIMGTNN